MLTQRGAPAASRGAAARPFVAARAPPRLPSLTAAGRVQSCTSGQQQQAVPAAAGGGAAAAPGGAAAAAAGGAAGKLLASLAAAVVLSSSAPALAFGPVAVKLEDLQVAQVDCASGTSTVSGVTFSGNAQKAACLLVQATATNPSGKPLYNADVFGRVYDVNGEAAIDDTENIRIAYIDELEPGTSSVAFKLYVPLEQFKLGPLKLQGFKASGFPGKMLPQTTGSGVAVDTSDCDILGNCDDLEAEAAIR